MFIKLQKKMWDASLDLTEKSLSRIIKDDSFLQWSSMGMNSSLWWQKNLGKFVDIGLKQLNLPDKESLKAINQSLFEMERELDLSKDRIKDLEAEVEQLRVLIKAKSEMKSQMKSEVKSKEKKIEVKATELKAKRITRKKKTSPLYA